MCANWSSATIVAAELERCGDYAKGVAKAARRITKCGAQMDTFTLRDMDVLARNMLERSTQAFLNRDVDVGKGRAGLMTSVWTRCTTSC